jgi:hypothetical protein
MSGVSMALVPAADHTLTPLHARVQLTEHVARLLSSAATARANSGAPFPQLSNIAGDAP